MPLNWRRAFAIAVAVWLLSWGLIRIGIWCGERFLPPSQGYPAPGAIQADLFRFDSVYYLDLASQGYHYNGDPNSSPNLVFAPAFPLLVAALDYIPWISTVSAGFILNKVLFLLGLTWLFAFLHAHFQRCVPAAAVLVAVATGAGSYAFHAFYSESTMLFALALALLSWQRGWWTRLALATLLLGASRLAALPFVMVFATLLARQAWRQRSWPLAAGAFTALTGVFAYLGYIGLAFGNPFTLLPSIQKASWGLFHPDVDPLRLLDGGYIVADLRYAFARATPFDIRTLNLAWVLLALAATVYALRTRWREPLTWAFVAYFGFVYASGGASEYLISFHRFLVFMLPIYFVFVAVVDRLPRRLGHALSALLLLGNAALGVLHTAMFNQGYWYWF